MDFLNNGAAVHSGSVVQDDIRAAIAKATGK